MPDLAAGGDPGAAPRLAREGGGGPPHVAPASDRGLRRIASGAEEGEVLASPTSAAASPAAPGDGPFRPDPGAAGRARAPAYAAGDGGPSLEAAAGGIAAGGRGRGGRGGRRPRRPGGRDPAAAGAAELEFAGGAGPRPGEVLGGAAGR